MSSSATMRAGAQANTVQAPKRQSREPTLREIGEGRWWTGKRASGAGGPEEGGGHRGTQRLGTPALVEAGRMAGRREGRCGRRDRPGSGVCTGIAVDRRDAVRVTGGR